MPPDATLELSLEQLITALDKKLFGECARRRSTLPPTSRTLVAAFTAEVRFRERKGSRRILTRFVAGRCPRETSQRGSTTSPFFEELGTTCEPSPPRAPHILRHFRLRCGSAADRSPDARLQILARVHQSQRQELEVNWSQLEEARPSVPRTRRGSPPSCGHNSTRQQRGRDFPQCVTSSCP